MCHAGGGSPLFNDFQYCLRIIFSEFFLTKKSLKRHHNKMTAIFISKFMDTNLVKSVINPQINTQTHTHTSGDKNYAKVYKHRYRTL